LCIERTDRGPRRDVDFIGEVVRGTRLRRGGEKHRLVGGLDIVLVPPAERVQAGDGPMAIELVAVACITARKSRDRRTPFRPQVTQNKGSSHIFHYCGCRFDHDGAAVGRRLPHGHAAFGSVAQSVSSENVADAPEGEAKHVGRVTFVTGLLAAEVRSKLCPSQTTRKFREVWHHAIVCERSCRRQG